MNRANQQLLFQATNQGLLNIRQAEINYYQSLNVAFGTQAALIGGFTYGVFSQNPVNYDNNYSNFQTLTDIYWVTSAITIAMSVHVILCTMLMQVLGPGLALNGPVGSMARATDGMRIEQKQIIISFILMMIMFSVSTVLSCWVVMTFEASVGCTISFAIASCYWYKYCERIWLRFHWNPDDAAFKRPDSVDSSDEDSCEQPVQEESIYELSPRIAAKIQRRKNGRRSLLSAFMSRRRNSSKDQDKHKTTARSSLYSQSTTAGTSRGGGSSKKNSHLTILSSLFAPTRDRNISDPSADLSSDGGTVDGAGSHTPKSIAYNGNISANNWSGAGVQNKKGVVMEGYLTKRGGSTQRYLDFRSEPWERRYFTLTVNSNLFIFKNRNEYRNDPKKPMFTRPLHLYEYYIEVYNMNDAIAVGEGGETASVIDDPANPYRFQMTLVLRENVDTPMNMPLTVTASGTDELASPGKASSPMATARRQQIYRDHWVLQCDTEEELLQWVAAIRDLCPSCFHTF